MSIKLTKSLKKLLEPGKEAAEYAKKRTGIKEIPLGPISKKLVMLQGYLNDQGEEPLIELKTKWLQEMIDEIDAKFQELLKVIHDEDD